jgi:16S rRNA (guanine966-N2)-methyltransferase
VETDPSPLRPTKAVVLKALRDMIRPVIEDLVVLDLFAGTGRVGEALIEEGARKVFAVDERESPDDLDEDVEWFRRNVDQFLNHGPPEPVDLVFFDPPYDSTNHAGYLTTISQAPWLVEEGIVIVETDRGTDLSATDPIDDFSIKRNRRYGNTRLWILQRLPDTSDGESGE